MGLFRLVVECGILRPNLKDRYYDAEGKNGTRAANGTRGGRKGFRMSNTQNLRETEDKGQANY